MKTLLRLAAALAVVLPLALSGSASALPKHKLLKIFELGPKQLSMSPDGKEVWATELYVHRVSIIDVEKMKLKKPIKLPKPEEPVEVVGWNGDALEAQAFAFLAVRSLAGKPLTYPQTTGVSAALTGGRRHVP